MDSMNASNFDSRWKDDHSSLLDNDPPDNLLDDEQLTSTILNGFDILQSSQFDEFAPSFFGGEHHETLSEDDWLVASPGVNYSSAEPNDDASFSLSVDNSALELALFGVEDDPYDPPLHQPVSPSALMDHCYTQSLHSPSDSFHGGPFQAAASEHMSDWSSSSGRLGSRESSVDDIFTLANMENRERGDRAAMLAMAGDQARSLVTRRLANRRKAGESSGESSAASSSQQATGGGARRTKPRAKPVPKLKKWNNLTEEEQLENITELANIISNQLGVRERYDAIKIIDPKCGISHTDCIDQFVLDKNVLKGLNNTRFLHLQRFVRRHAGDYGSEEPAFPDPTEQSQPVRLLVDVTNDVPASPPRKSRKQMSYPYETEGMGGAGVAASRTPSRAGRKRKYGGGRRGRKSPYPTELDDSKIWIDTTDEEFQRQREMQSGLFNNMETVNLNPNEASDEELDILF